MTTELVAGRRLAVPVLGLSLAAVGALAVAGLADSVTDSGGIVAYDRDVTSDVVAVRSPHVTQLAQTLTDLADVPVLSLLTVVTAALLLLRTRTWRAPGLLLIAMTGSAILTYSVKLVVQRRRPGAGFVVGPVDNGFAFPSGHTLNSAVFLGVLAGLAWAGFPLHGRQARRDGRGCRGERGHWVEPSLPRLPLGDRRTSWLADRGELARPPRNRGVRRPRPAGPCELLTAAHSACSQRALPRFTVEKSDERGVRPMNLLDPHSLLSQLGPWAVLLVLFAETGLLIGFFLPGDSLLFTAGLLTATGPHLSLPITIVFAAIGAVAGAQVGYLLGRRIGPAILNRPGRPRLARAALGARHQLESYGVGRAVVLARFVPGIRTVMNPLAGALRVDRWTFTRWQIAGGVLWTVGLVLAGHLLGAKVQGVDKYLLPIIAVIVVISLIPVALEALRHRRSRPV